jgi:hypothetical protein
MQPELWKPPVELSQQEEQIVKKIRKAKLFVFLRQHRHELLDEAFQEELASLYRKAERGQPKVGSGAAGVGAHPGGVYRRFR